MRALEKRRFKNRNGEQTTLKARDARPPQRVGPSRRFVRRSGSRRYAPPLPQPDRPRSPGFIFEEVLEGHRQLERTLGRRETIFLIAEVRQWRRSWRSRA